jgi:RNA processing factor Prp31
MARKLAAKVSLVARYDAFRDRDSQADYIVKKKEEVEGEEGTQLEEIRAVDVEMGIECRAYLEGELKRAQQLVKKEELDGMPAAKRPRLQ